MINIHFDHQIFSLQQYGGISRYFCELAAHLNQMDGVKPKIIPFLHQNKHLLEATRLAGHSRYVRPIRRTTLLRFAINTFLFEVYSRFCPPDIIHRTYYGINMARKSKQVTTIHDLIPEKFPEYFDNVDVFLRLKHQSIVKSDYILCVSNTTKKDLLAYYPIPESKISVIHLAASIPPCPISSTNTAIVKNMLTIKPYILYVGARSGYKNFSILLKAISNSKNIKKHYNLLCFGGLPFSRDELDLIDKLDLSNHVFQFNGDDNLLSCTYQRAAIFVYPSLYEGFGLPLLEAMSLGCPVACSDIDVFKEISDESACIFDPKCESSILDALEKVLYSEKRRRELIELGYENAKRFSWKKSAERTLSIYNKLLLH